MLLVDAHLDLSMNALSLNRDLNLAIADLRAHEVKRGLTEPGRGHNTVTLPELRKGEVFLSVVTVIARATRPDDELASDTVKRYVAWGVGPRGAQAVVQASKVRAMLHGRDRPNLDDVHALAVHAFRHRLVLNFRGEAEGETAEGIIREVLAGGAGDRRRTTVAAGGDRRRTTGHRGRVARR